MRTKQTFLGLNKKMCFNTVAREQEEGGGETQEKLIRTRKKKHRVLLLH